MQAKTFFYINALIVALIIWRILASRKVDQPTPLEIGREPERRPAANIPKDQIVDDGPTQTEFNASAFKAKGTGRKVNFAEPQERSLNCWFQFNGHTWDAFEVLGVPAGSTRDSCYRALIDLRHRRPQETDFFDQAWAALERHFSS